MSRLRRKLYILAGCLCLGLGCIGIFLPLLPTTPFILLAAFCFSRGSDKLYDWLLEQKTFGPLIRNWRQHGVIRTRVKCTATVLIIVLMGSLVAFSRLSMLLKVSLVVIALSVIGFICSRPSSTIVLDANQKMR